MKKLEKPNNLSEMINIAEKISKYFNFIRIDMYTNNKEIFVGEITNIHGGATEKFLPSGYFSEIQFSKLYFMKSRNLLNDNYLGVVVLFGMIIKKQ